MQGRLSLFAELWFKIIIVGISPLLDVCCFTPSCNECFNLGEPHRDFSLILTTIVSSHWEMTNLVFLNKCAIMIATGVSWTWKYKILSQSYPTFFLKPDYFLGIGLATDCVVELQDWYLWFSLYLGKPFQIVLCTYLLYHLR